MIAVILIFSFIILGIQGDQLILQIIDLIFLFCVINIYTLINIGLFFQSIFYKMNIIPNIFVPILSILKQQTNITAIIDHISL